ncbi:MAG: SDR family NAD(P)-dependent oxidoreductase [Acidimicrobiales bacterium]
MTDLKDKTALVTGSTSGIGKATAIALAARGAHVLVVGRDEQRAKDVVAEIEGSGGSATFRLTTLGDLESARGWSSGPLRQATVTSTSSSTTLASACSGQATQLPKLSSTRPLH